MAEGAKWGLGKRDIVSNINFFMNVPVEADGTLGIVDGLSAPGKSLTLRAERDTLVLVSNCPQINNPCNGFDPTPVRMVISADALRQAAHRCSMTAIEVVRPGMLTTVQDWPGRIGYWHVGVPPSGPMDDLSFRIGNRVLGNPEGTAGLECTRGGPALAFPDGGRVCVTGAPVGVTLDGAPVPQWQSITRRRAAECSTSAMLTGPGMRCYVLVAGGLQEPEYLGSTATFTLGAFGGHGGRPLREGDVLTAGRRSRTTQRPPGAGGDRRAAKHRAPLGDRGHRRSARRAGVLHPRRHRHAGRHRLHRALQFRSHRRAAGRPEAAVGAQRRR